MKLLTLIFSLFIFSQCYAEPVNTVGIPLPLNDIDSVSIYIDGYSYYLNEAVRPYQAVRDYGTELKNAVSSVRVSHYIQTKDYVKLRAELAGVIPTDEIETVINYMQGTVKSIRQFIDWVLWRNEYRSPNNVPDGNVFLLINDLNIGFEKIYDNYFNSHKGKTMVVFSWETAKENYIRQYMFQFAERYKDRIYGVIPNYGGQNNIDFKGDYNEYHESIGTVINWFKANTKLPVGLTICKTRDDSDDRFAEVMKDLSYDFVYLWGLHDFSYEFDTEFGEANRWANGRPVILGGFWGNLQNPTGMLPEAILADMSYKFPSFVSQIKSKWKGLHIIGERWDAILQKCADRGITIAPQ